jgi:hypothetical protein
LDDPEPLVRAEAATALGEFGKDAQSAVPALRELQRKEELDPGPASKKSMIKSTRFIVKSTGFIVSSSWATATAPTGPFDPDVVGRTTTALNRIDAAAAAEADPK